jgi:competence protein ComEC
MARRRALAGLLLCFALGGARYVATLPDLGPGHVSQFNGGPSVTLLGEIVAEPDRRDRRTDYRIRVASVWDGRASRAMESIEGLEGLPSSTGAGAWRPARGLVLAQLPSFPPHAYGERAILEGKMEAAPVLEGFDYRAWLARKDIHSLARRPRLVKLDEGHGWALRRFLIGLRQRGRRALAASLPEPEASLATGILLGDARGIPEPVDAAFRLTNTSHVIAISGSNISLLVILLLATLGRWLGPRRAMPAILITLALYSALVGADAAVIRAAIMGALMVLAGHLGRPGDATAALMAAAWGMSAWNPDVLWDLGFQLSFAATAGLIAFSARFAGGLQGLLERRLDRGRAQALVRLSQDALLVTLAAQLATWPIIAWQMGQVSVTGLAANFLILPAQPAVMGLGGLAMAFGMLWEPAGRLLGLAAWLPLTWTIRVVEIFADLPLASVALPLPAWAMLLWYLGLAAAAHPSAPSRLRLGSARLRAWGNERFRSGGRKAGAGVSSVWSSNRVPQSDPQADDPRWTIEVPPSPDSRADPYRYTIRESVSIWANPGESLRSDQAKQAKQANQADQADDGSRLIEARPDAVRAVPVPVPAEPRESEWDRKSRGGAIKPGKRGRLYPLLVWALSGWRPVLPIATLATLSWLWAYSQPDGLLHLHMLDVGQGDAILVVTPEGKRMLVDGGPSPSALLDGLGRSLPPWDRRIDLVVLTHPDGDHVGGLPALLARYQVGAVLDPELPADSPDAEAWDQALAASTVPRIRAAAGGNIILDEAAGVWAEILWPPEPRLSGSDAAANDNSVVLRLHHGRLSMLLTGDIEAAAEDAILATGADLSAQLLKVAHHGSEGSSTPEFIAAVAPSLALIGVGADNRYGHPAAGALERLAPALIRRTDQLGAIEVISDGRDLWLP